MLGGGGSPLFSLSADQALLTAPAPPDPPPRAVDAGDGRVGRAPNKLVVYGGAGAAAVALLGLGLLGRSGKEEAWPRPPPPRRRGRKKSILRQGGEGAITWFFFFFLRSVTYMLQAACPAPGSSPDRDVAKITGASRSPSRRRFGSTHRPRFPPGAKPTPFLIPSQPKTRPVIPCPTPHPQTFDSPVTRHHEDSIRNCPARLCRGRHPRRLNSTRLQGATP